MDWKEVAGTVTKVAPMLGTLLGGPVGGAIGGVVALIGSALGLTPAETTPDKINQLLATDPTAAVKLAEIEAAHKVELQKLLLEQDRLMLQERQAELATAGKPKFEIFCASCHGLDGKGIQAVGAPNLTDGIWLYAPTADEIRYGIVNGRNNQMPAQLELLGEQKVRLLAAYVLSLAPPYVPPVTSPPAGETAAAPAGGDAAAAVEAPAADAG